MSMKSFRKLISPETAKSLESQRYSVVGSHSAVKICRWTKNSLANRGGCYKHSFYGINSSLCMETTTSVACANKCTFCWRQNSHPVTKKWKYETDDPIDLLDDSIFSFQKLCKQLPNGGVLDTFNFQDYEQLLLKGPKHIALSLVGEAIIYPHIVNYIKYCSFLKISTFLVTNGQFPEAIKFVFFNDMSEEKSKDIIDETSENRERRNAALNETFISHEGNDLIEPTDTSSNTPTPNNNESDEPLTLSSSVFSESDAPITKIHKIFNATKDLKVLKGVKNSQSKTPIKKSPIIDHYSSRPTQFYLSIDASNPTDLIAVDRPLFIDAWERLIESIDLVYLVNSSKERLGGRESYPHYLRTVARLTAISNVNMKNSIEYAELIQRGDFTFVEIKGATYASWEELGTSKLTFENVPKTIDVLKFAKDLEKALCNSYEIVSFHDHSASVLLLNKRVLGLYRNRESFDDPADFYPSDFLRANIPKTFIDYNKCFNRLDYTYTKTEDLLNNALKINEKLPSIDEYSQDTPKWAIYGSKDQGFDPSHQRKQRRPAPTDFMEKMEAIV